MHVCMDGWHMKAWMDGWMDVHAHASDTGGARAFA